MIKSRSFTVVLMWTLLSTITPTSHDLEHYSDFEDFYATTTWSYYNDLEHYSDHEDFDDHSLYHPIHQTFSNPHVRVARWMDNDDNVMVGCVHEWNQIGHFFLTVTGGTNITIVDPHIITVEASFFNITVTPPVSITCVLDILGQNLTSEEYTLGAHYGSEPQMPPVSLSYQLFAGFIGFVLIIMTLVVIVFTLRGKQAAGPDKTTECNIYEKTITV
ncbi:uncharacterized protein LOC134086888 [Sardina pilchardus]|uniref:uncharacterized protein LOC134086888 n=1 Tax=Sardina pilchardus TaxID=27697 RepID=UPI002E13E562